jgi:hypothetical protein
MITKLRAHFRVLQYVKWVEVATSGREAAVAVTAEQKEIENA